MTSQDFTYSFWVTAAFTVISVITVNVFAFCIALLLTRKLRGTNFFRTVFFLPNLIGGIVLGYTWRQMINAVLFKYGTTIVSQFKYGFVGLIILMNWRADRLYDDHLYCRTSEYPDRADQAAEIDGATHMQTLFKVKIPMVMPSITICIFLTLSNSFKLFDQNLSLTAGAPLHKTEMLALNIYQTFLW